MKPGPLALLYGTVSFLLLRLKVSLTPAWFDGSLERQHALLVDGQYTNNEQSRLLSFVLPEALQAALGLSVNHAYVVTRFVFVGASLWVFHVYLRAWFGEARAALCAALVSLVAAFTFRNDLQESSPLLMLTFVLALWATRETKLVLLAGALLLGVLNNETTLALVPLLFLYAVHDQGWRAAPKALLETLAVSLPAVLTLAAIRYWTRDRPHLGGAWHGPDNLRGFLGQVTASPLDWEGAPYLHFLLMFGAFWFFAFRGLRAKPAFLRASLWLVPALFVPHALTGIIGEPRQMIPLAFVLVPAAVWSLVPGDLEKECVLDARAAARPVTE